MQTFLPSKSFKLSAQMLDYQRLGKQRVEVLQILKALTIEEYGWKNHPATKMWRGHTNALVSYGLAICEEWLARGYKDTCLGKIQAFYQPELATVMPDWIENKDVYSSHRSNLLRKNYVHYSKFDWEETKSNYEETSYFWPV